VEKARADPDKDVLPRHSINLLHHCTKRVLKKVVADFMLRYILGL